MASTERAPEEASPSITTISPEELEGLPESTKVAVVQASMFSGPLPPPALYDAYEQVVAGSAERILTLAEKEQSHRHAFDGKAMEKHFNEVSKGQSIGSVIAVCCIGAACFCAYIDQPWVATVLVGTTAVNLVTGFIRGRSSRDDS